MSRPSPIATHGRRDPALWLAFVAIGLGALLRLDPSLLSRSCWLDEAFIANVVAGSGWADLFAQPLQYSHFVPPGFLVVTKLLALPFGFRDWALRLFPLFCGIASLPLLFYVGCKYASRWAAALATSLLAISKFHVYYSAELKQYSTDAFVGLCLLALFPHVGEKIQTTRGRVLLAVVGMLAPWFSHPSVFFLAAGGLLWSLHLLRRREWRSAALLAAVGASWIASFLAQYNFVMRGGLSASSPIAPWLFEFWGRKGAFMPSFALEGALWMHTALVGLLTHAGNLGNATLAVLFFWVGVLSLLRRNRPALFLLVSPMLFAMLASHFRAYIFATRLLLFLVPTAYLVISAGIAQFKIRTDRRYAMLINYPLALLLLGLLFNPLPKWDHPVQEFKPAMQFLAAHRSDDEAIYVFFWSEPAFRFYAPSFGIETDACRIIRPLPEKRFAKEIDYYRMSQAMAPAEASEGACVYGTEETAAKAESELEAMSKLRRVWFVFSHVQEVEVDRFLFSLGRAGVMKRSHRFRGASAFLFDFGGGK